MECDKCNSKMKVSSSTEYEYLGLGKHDYVTYYFWKCPKCGKLIDDEDLNERMNDMKILNS